MVKWITLLLLLMLLLFSPTAHAQGEPSRGARLSVQVTDLRNTRGDLRLGVFDRAGGFPRDRKAAVLWQSMPADNAKRTFDVELPPGEYAVVVLHDENGNKKLDVGLFGIPKEGHGVTNNPKPLYRGPTYEEARFTLPLEGAQVRVSMQYTYH
jgi:uncharacterized protein (DUF2141 family)